MSLLQNDMCRLMQNDLCRSMQNFANLSTYRDSYMSACGSMSGERFVPAAAAPCRYNYTVHRTTNVRNWYNRQEYLGTTGLPVVRTFFNFWSQVYDVRTFFKAGATTSHTPVEIPFQMYQSRAARPDVRCTNFF